MPGAFSETGTRRAGRRSRAFGAPLVPHVRTEADGVLGAVGEMIEVSRRSGAPLHLSHLKVIGNPELVESLLALIDEASADVDITFDQYPYGAGSTVLSSLLPPGRTREVHPTRSGAWTIPGSARRWPATSRKGCPTGTTRMARAGPRTS